MLKIKKINYSRSNKNLWYYNLKGKEYPIVMVTKGGYLVSREETSDSKLWNVKKKHASILDDDIV